ncbi:nose resistant to fluoxetine protein 6 isoform X3 [Drosophila mojavensis]|uniref:nose resistant to fluoxetine protein 6 isoform X3 n=1 Tax=Drosophila mojavensis TaxID=7230 RepID=UPI001CD0E8D9|nr:nose resistant to fluoxetine protein 6 isoform X3 [Drosophila mojavensis]
MIKASLVLLCLLCGLIPPINAVGMNVEQQQHFQMEPMDYPQIRKLQSLNLKFTEYFQNRTLKDLDIFSTRLPNRDDLQCIADMGRWMNDLKSGRLWSMKMIDSWGSLPSGILYLNLLDMGNYGECIKINKQVSSGHSIKGKYCLTEIPILKMLGVPVNRNLKIGICFPSSCSAAHMDLFLSKVIQQVIGSTSITSLVKEQKCRINEREPLDGIAILTIVLLSIFAALALLATLYDYFLVSDQAKFPALIKIFSIRATSRSLFRITPPKSNPNVIECLHGMRCLSLIWVILGHEYMLNAMGPNVNGLGFIYWAQRPFSQIIVHAEFAVDSFFFLSGMLVVMVALRAMERSKGKLNVPLMYLHRYLRLTPLLAMAILVYMKLLPLMVDGPLANDGFDDAVKCRRTWFWTLLYVQNYATEEICLAHSWYLSVDMQMYILSPLLLFALYKWGKKAAIGAVILTVLLTVYLFTIMMISKHSVFFKNQDGSHRLLYFYTHTHAAPWLIGAVFGYFLHANRGKVYKLNQSKVWPCWLIALAIFFACEFSLLPYVKWIGRDLSTLSDSLYYSLTRVGWPIALCWVIFACMQGYGGMANSFLSSPLWQPMSKLSYSAYVWHMFIEELNARRYQSNTYFSNYEMMLKFWEDFGFTMLISYLTYITIEAPLGGLEGLLLPSRRPSPKSHNDVESAPDAPSNAPAAKT